MLIAIKGFVVFPYRLLSVLSVWPTYLGAPIDFWFTFLFLKYPLRQSYNNKILLNDLTHTTLLGNPEKSVTPPPQQCFSVTILILRPKTEEHHLSPFKNYFLEMKLARAWESEQKKLAQARYELQTLKLTNWRYFSLTLWLRRAMIRKISLQPTSHRAFRKLINRCYPCDYSVAGDSTTL